MPEEEKKDVPVEKPEEKPKEIPAEKPAEEKPVEAKQEAPVEEKPKEEIEFDPKAKFEELEKAVQELATQVSAIKEALEAVETDEGQEVTAEKPDVPPPVAEPKVEEPKEKEEAVKFAKDLSDMQKKIDGLEAIVAKFSNQGMKKTVQSSSVVPDPMADAVKANLKKYNF